MSELLFWVYLVNSALLIDHEIDSAYWREWDLFHLPGGRAGFLALHVPLLFFVLYGLVLVYTNTFAGLIFSLILGASGVFAFGIHTFFIKKGKPEFRGLISQSILVATLLVSVVQLVITISLLIE